MSDVDARIQALLDKQEIHEVLAHYCRGLDRGDKALLRATFHPDGTHDHGGTIQSADQLVDGLDNPARLKVLKSVAHTFGNALVELDGDAAAVESYFLACHRFEHEGAAWDWMVGGRYVDRFERRDGVWRIAHRTAVYDWARADPVGERPEGVGLVSSADGGQWGRGDAQDFSYSVFSGTL
jgi:hypothetical protein